MVGIADVHKFDEAQDNALAFAVAGDGQNFAVIHPALHDHINFHTQPRGARRGDTLKDASRMMSATVHRPENSRIQRVETHGHAVQARLGQSGRQFRKEQPVGRHGDVLQGGKTAQPVQEFFHSAPQEGFAAGDAQLADPAADEGADNAAEFGQPQELILAQENMVVVEDLRRHAVGATQIAAIGERNAQIMHRAGEKI